MEIPELDYNGSSFNEELFTLLPEQNFEETLNSDSNQINFENSICLKQTSKSFTMNSDDFKSLIEFNESSKIANNFYTNKSEKSIDFNEKDTVNTNGYLKENFSFENQLDTYKNNDVNFKEHKDSEAKNTKIKFKNVLHFKNDLVIKKLIKTIDVMSKELNKRDELIMAMEKENSILSANNSNVSSSIPNAREQAYYLVEISRQKQEVLNYKNENENLHKKINFLEKQLNEFKKEDQSHLSEYKKITSPKKFKSSRDSSIENIIKLTNENDELKDLNRILNIELEKLSKQIDLIEKRKNLEKEIAEKFEDVIKQKEMLEEENNTLLKKVDVLREEMKICLTHFEDDLTELRKFHEKELMNIRTEFEIEETKSIQMIKSLRQQLNDADLVIEKLDGERTYLMNTLKSTKEESSEYERHLKSVQNLLEKVELENEKNKKNSESLYDLNLEQQRQIQKLINDLETKSQSSEKMCLKKGDELKRLKQALNLSQEKLRFHQIKYENELEEQKKKFFKEIEQLKFSNEQMTVRNGELSRSNGELRKKIQNFELDLKSLHEKYTQIKQNNEFLTKQKKELKEENDRITFTHKKDLDVLEKLRDEYLKKNNTQQLSIDKMIEQISNFQKEIDSLIKRNEDLDSKLKQKSQAYNEYKKKYVEIKAFVKKELFPNNQNIQKQQEEVAKLNQNILNFINGLINDLNLDNNNEELSDSF